MRKGFTLIELLAVIVILAIIAVIATPIVLNIINEAKENAVLRSAEFYLDGVEAAIVSATLKNITILDNTYNILENGDICLVELVNNACPQDKILEVSVKGDKPKEGTITITGGTISNVDIVISDKNIWINPETEKIEVKEDVVLAPGLYDENNKLIMSWDELISEEISYMGYSYEMDSSEGTLKRVEKEFKSTILTVSEAGLLYPATDDENTNYSAEYLSGKLVLDESVKSIADITFRGNASLTSIIIPDSVTSIAEDAFLDCDSLTTIYYNGTDTGYPWGAPNSELITDF